MGPPKLAKALESSELWRQRAVDARKMAATIVDAGCKQAALEIALSYDELAEVAAQIEAVALNDGSLLLDRAQ
jgi:hypothetical protein